MFVRSKTSAPVRQRGGLRSYVLLEEGDVADAAMAVTWVEVEPGSEQRVHRHAPQQLYVIAAGSGRMMVGDEERDVKEGDLVFIPSRAPHRIANTGDHRLVYLSAASPAFSITRLYDTGELSDQVDR